MSASIEIPGASKTHTSESDFVVINESPSTQLSDVDVLDGLQVNLRSTGIQSISLRDDIEKLYSENDQLKETVAENEQTMKKHIQLCTQYKQNMDKRHETDAMMIEEARLMTLSLKKENETLKTCLENKQTQLEKAIITEYELKKSMETLETAHKKLQEELSECAVKVEDAQQRADEASFVQVEDGQEMVAVLKQEIDQLKEELESSAIEKVNVKELQLKLQESVEQLSSSEEQLKKATEQIKDLEARLEALDHDHTDILKQISLGTAGFNEEREIKMQELSKKILSLEADLSAKAKILETAQSKLTQSNLEADRLKERLSVIMEEKKQLDGSLVARDFLKCDLESQIEALKLALRSEQSQRDEAEKGYANLLQTWQAFERNVQRPVVELSDGTPLGSMQDVDRAAQDLATADRLRMESDLQELRETVKKFQVENARLLQQTSQQQQQIAQQQQQIEQQQQRVQRGFLNRSDSAGAAAAQLSSLQCPLCCKYFERQTELIQHAGNCGEDQAE